MRSLSSKIVKGPLGDKDDRDHTLHSACLQFDWILLYQTRKYVVIGSKVTKYKIQTGDQKYSYSTPYGASPLGKTHLCDKKGNENSQSIATQAGNKCQCIKTS